MSVKPRKYYTIEELTGEFEVTTRTLRFYEDKGLLKPVRQGRKRLYRPRDRARLRLILRGKRLGMSLADIQEVIRLYDAEPGERAQLLRLLEVLTARRADLEQKRRDLEETMAELDAVETVSRARLAELDKTAAE